MLKLVYNATEIEVPPAQKAEEPIVMAPFAATVELKGPNLYLMDIRDSSHYLKCELTLEIENSLDPFSPGTLICHFPEISDEKLNAFIWEDDTLYAIILIQFQMKILKELLLFCNDHFLSRIVIYPDNAESEDFDIYQEFLVQDEQFFTESDSQTELIIPANQETYADWIEFMNEAKVRFQQTLWREQRNNPAIRYYLTMHPFGEDY